MSGDEKPATGPTIPTRRCPADGCGANYLRGSSGAWFCPHGHGVLAVAKEGATVIRFGSWRVPDAAALEDRIMTPTIPPAVSAARSACEALADRLRRGADASLETADACTALRALAAAWAAVLPRLAEDVTPPEWPEWKPSACSKGPRILASHFTMKLGGERDVDAIDAYADALRAWGREAAACEEETWGECPRCGEPCPVGADCPSAKCSAHAPTYMR